jgi:hypothetical protein
MKATAVPKTESEKAGDYRRRIETGFLRMSNIRLGLVASYNSKQEIFNTDFYW